MIVRLPDDPVEIVPQAVNLQNMLAQFLRLGRSQRNIKAVFLQDAQQCADAGINGIAVHALRAENARIAFGGFIQPFCGHVQQVVKGIPQGRAYHLPQFRALRNDQSHFLHGFSNRGNDAFLRVEQRAVQIKNHRVVRKIPHAASVPSASILKCKAGRMFSYDLQSIAKNRETFNRDGKRERRRTGGQKPQIRSRYSRFSRRRTGRGIGAVSG